MNMEFGMPTLIELSNLEETMSLCKELGLAFVELNMNFPQYQIEQLEKVDYLKQLAEQYQLFYTIHLDENLNISDFNHGVAQAYMETVRRAIAVAKALHAPIINMHMNHGIHITLPEQKVRLFEVYKEEYLESMQQFRNMCQENIGNADIKICIENTDGFYSYEKEAIELLLESDVFALTFDIGHSHACGDLDEAFIVGKKDRLMHFHIHDGKGSQNHMLLGTGEIDLQQRLAQAQECGCRCVVETKTVEALRQSIGWLRRGNYYERTDN